MSEPITYVGIDAHKAQLQVAMLTPEATEPVIWTVRNEARTVNRLRRKLEKAAPGPIACCYEAGPCGYALQRQLERGRVRCAVIAPALVPRKPGERIKTDRRDARKLAELHRARLLTVVRAPTPAEEAVRDLCRARDDARMDRQRCRHRLGKLLLRRGLHYPGRAVDPGAPALGQWSVMAASGRPGGRRRLPAGHRPPRSPAAGTGCAVGRGGRHGAVSGTGGLAAVLPRHRHAECGAVARRAARRAAVSDGACVDGVSGTGARRALQR